MSTSKENNQGYKKKILFLDHTPFIGGAQLFLTQHLEKIDREKYEVIVGCSPRALKLGLVDDYNGLGVQWRPISFGRLKTLNPSSILRLGQSVRDIIMIMRKEKVDFVFCNTVRACIAGSLACLFGREKMIWFVHDYTFPSALFKLLKGIPRKIIYNSRALIKHYAPGDDRKNIVVHVGSNIHEKTQEITENQIEQTRKQWGASRDTIVIGYIGRLVGAKGPQVLIEALDILLRGGRSNVKCIIVGSGRGQAENNEQALKALVRKKELVDYVIFTGYQKDVARYLSSFDIFCFTSIQSEAFGLSIIEAMMCRAPVIATDIAGPREVIKDGETGLLVVADDAERLCYAMKKLIADSRLKKRIVNNAYEYAMENFTAEHATRQLEGIYSEI